MENFHCLLCLSSLDKDIPCSTKSSIKEQIVRLYDLLVPEYHTSTPHQTIIAQCDGHDIFKLCKNCSLSAKEIEKIKQQLTQLEKKIARKVEELRTVVSNSFSKEEKIEESLQSIRKSLLLSSGYEDSNPHILTDLKVKPEPDEDVPNYEEQLPTTSSPTPTNQSDDQDDPLFSLNDAEEISDSSSDDGSPSSDASDFYITPDNTNKDKKNKRTTKSDSKNESSSPPPKRKRIRKYVPKRKKYDESCYTLSCAVCSSKFRKERHLRLHLRQEHKGFCQFQCQICQHRHDTQTLLDSHMIVRHESEEKSFFCTKPKCGKGFTLEVNFLSHMERHKLDKTKPVVCTVCDARFANQAYLEKHNVIHVTSWMCETCGAQLATRDAFRRHVRLHLGEKPYKCDQCEESFAYLNARKLHMLRAHAPQRHICHICGKTFTLKQYLKTHIDKVHEKVKKHECVECGEKFCTLEHLRAHNVREHNAEPIVCDECGATFASRTLLKCHKIRHSGIKKHECSVCGARYYTKKALEAHQTSHSDVRNHICHDCGAAFKTRINLMRHLKNVHGIFGAKRGAGGTTKKSKLGTQGQKVTRGEVRDPAMSHVGVNLDAFC